MVLVLWCSVLATTRWGIRPTVVRLIGRLSLGPAIWFIFVLLATCILGALGSSAIAVAIGRLAAMLMLLLLLPLTVYLVFLVVVW